MAKGDIYDMTKYSWQLRKTASKEVFIRYDEHIDENNKGRYNTSVVVDASVHEGKLKVTTKSGSVYWFNTHKCAFPMHLLSLTLRFGMELN